MVVSLFEIRHVWVVVFIMAMAGVAGPIARWRKNLCNQKAFGHVAVFHGNIIYKTGILSFAALGERDAFWSQALRFVATFARRCTNG